MSPDGLSLVCSCTMTVWAQCHVRCNRLSVAHTLATSYRPTCRKMCYRQEVLQRPRLRERRPYAQYTLSANQRVFPVAVETLRPLSDEAHSLIAEIGRRATHCTADPREATFLCRRTWQFSVSMQCALPTRSLSHDPIVTFSGAYNLYIC